MWYEVDKDGLKQLLEGKDKSFIIRELLQNAIDEPGVTTVDVTIEPLPGKRLVKLTVTDDAPEGFYDLRHSYTLYAKTRKRPDPEKRGRFNLGEKQVLALAQKALIRTTTGQVLFTEDGKRHEYRSKNDPEHCTERGSRVELTIPMTRDEIAEIKRAAQSFIVPREITFTVDGERIEFGDPVTTTQATLMTEYEDEKGQWRRSQRKTKIEVYAPRNGEKPILYELGLPVVELEGGDPWHLNVMQRVPLNSDRDNVSPAFIRDLRAEVLNKLANRLSGEQAAESWVSDATDDERIAPEAVREVVRKRFGDKVVVGDPSDPESRERAILAGYTIVPARSMSSATWANVRAADAVPPSSQLFGTKDVERTTVPEKKWTKDMRTVAEVTKRIAEETGCHHVTVQFFRSRSTRAAEYSSAPPRTVAFNLQVLGGNWCHPSNLDQHVRLIVHELAHEAGGHLDAGYIRRLSEIASELFRLDRRKVLGDANKYA